MNVQFNKFYDAICSDYDSRTKILKFQLLFMIQDNFFVGDLFTKGECFRKLRSPLRFAAVEMTKENKKNFQL